MAEFWQWQGDLHTGSGYVMLKDYGGRQGKNTIFGDTITAHRATQINVQFQYNLATFDVTTTIIDTGTATQSDHQGIVSTGTGVSGSATIQSIDNIKYLPGHEGYALFTSLFTTPVNGVTQEIGIHDDDNGYMIGFIDTNFAIIRRRDGIDHITYQSEFNLDKLDGSGSEGLNVDFTKGNVWRITYGWLGYAVIIFEVMESNGTWTAFHKIEYPNANTETNIGNPVLPMRMQVKKTGGLLTANITMKTGSWNAGIVDGSSQCCNRYFSFESTATFTSNFSLTNVFTLKSASAFQTFKNKVLTRMLFLSASCDGVKLTSIKIIKNASLGVTATYTFIDSGNSTIQYDTTLTTVSGGQTLLTLQLGKTDSKIVDMSNFNAIIHPTDTLTFAAISSLATDVSISARWAEEF